MTGHSEVLNTATTPALCKPLLVAVEKVARQGSPQEGSCFFTQHQPRLGMAVRPLPAPPLPSSFDSLHVLFLCLEAWHEIHPPSSSVSGGPQHARQKCTAFCFIIQKNWGPHLENSNNNAKYLGTWFFFFFTLKKTIFLLCKIRPPTTPSLLDLIPSNWFLCFLLFLKKKKNTNFFLQ